MCLSTGVKQQAPLPLPVAAPPPVATQLSLKPRANAVNRRKGNARPTSAVPAPAGGGLSIAPGGGQRA
jgi:hypothetical protein